MGDPVRYSVSALRTQATCPARFYFRTLAKLGTIKEDPAYPLVFGSAAHEGFELAISEGKDPHEVAEAYLQRELYQKFPEFDFKDAKEAKKLAEISAKMHRCIDHFQEHFFGSILETVPDRTTATEVTLEVPFRKGTLRGVIDLIPMDGVFVDWKTGKVPEPKMLLVDPQAKIYYHIAKGLGMPLPRVFEYVYLIGLPTVKTPELDDDGKAVKFKSGPRKGETKFNWDTENFLKFSFPVFQDDSSVDRMMLDYVNGTAAAYEQGIIYKNRSAYTCGTCQYRTACPTITLPEVIEDREVLDVRAGWDDKEETEG